MNSPPPQTGMGTITALSFFILASVWIGLLANRAMQKGSFLQGFFLGNRGLGSWALALTATVQSGGTFMGFPSLVYSHGWVVALWISSYMVVPITGFGVLGKRLAQLSRRTDAITLPDLFRERFHSPLLGLMASLMILFYMSFMMVAQFKAGAIVMKLAWPGTGSLALVEDLETGSEMDVPYLIGLGVFTVTVVGYTLLGGFLAAVWTDLFQSVMMLFGVVTLLVLALVQSGGMEQATLTAASHTGPGFVFGPGFDPSGNGREFLPLGLACSFFAVWVFSGLGSPAGMVRIMASSSTETIRRSIYLLSVYNALIYLPLVMICICGRALIPDLPPGKTDEIIPRLALSLTSTLPAGSFMAGLILAAPFGAVMATVSSYLVVIASGLVRDVYQRFLHPHATEFQLRRMSTMVMVAVGGVAILANIRPVAYLQAIVVFSGTGAAATFCFPALMAAYWRRATTAGVLTSMLAGAFTMVALYVAGFLSADPLIGQVTRFRPYFLLGIDPLIWGLTSSLLMGVAVTLLTRPPPPELVSRLFDTHHVAAVQHPKGRARLVLTILTLIGGLLFLTAGAEILVRGASALAIAARISPLVVGLTVVAFGTSTPELVVSIQSSLRGQPDVAMGNVVGSNIFNVLFILGASALITPLQVSQKLVRFDVPLMIGLSALVAVMAWDGNIGLWDGLLLTGGLVSYTSWGIWESRSEQLEIQREYAAEFGLPPGSSSMGQLLLNVAFVAIGLALLIFGCSWFTDAAVKIAREIGVSELVIGLTIVAIGTSLPEVATSLMAACRGERDIAVGNVVGSNLFNIMGVLGLSGIVSEAGVAVSADAFRFDIPVMIVVAFACLPIFFTGHRIARWEGALFLGYFAAYTGYLILAAVNPAITRTLAQIMLGFVLPLTAVTLAIMTIRALRSPDNGRAVS